MADYAFNWFPSAIDADEDVTPAEQDSQEGIMRRSAPSDTKEASDSPNFLRNAIRSMANGFTGGPEEAKRVLGAGLTKDKYALQEEAVREFLDILTSSGDDPLVVDEQGRPAESFRPTMRPAELMAPVDDTETVRPVMRPVSREEDTTMVPTTSTARKIVQDEIGLTPELWDVYREEVAAIESGGLEDPYSAKGGANDHYDGMYQLGRVAKQDAAQLLGITLGHDAGSRQDYRSRPDLQEDAFAAYTAKNHSYLMSKSEKYRNLPLKEKMAVLGYAHNQGWSGADKWLRTGEAGEDAFGTKGTKYYDALSKRLMALE